MGEKKQIDTFSEDQLHLIIIMHRFKRHASILNLSRPFIIFICRPVTIILL